MNKEIKAFIDDEYKEIYENLNINWLKGLKIKKQELSHKGLLNSGIAQKMLIDYAISLINNNNVKIKDLIVESQNKFKFEMPKEEIENYINKSIESNTKYLDIFSKELLEYFKRNNMLFAESSIIQFSNAKANNKAELEKIKKELILINKSQNNKSKEKKKLSKGDIIGIISIIVAILLFILGLIFA